MFNIFKLFGHTDTVAIDKPSNPEIERVKNISQPVLSIIKSFEFEDDWNVTYANIFTINMETHLSNVKTGKSIIFYSECYSYGPVSNLKWATTDENEAIYDAYKKMSSLKAEKERVENRKSFDTFIDQYGE